MPRSKTYRRKRKTTSKRKTTIKRKTTSKRKTKKKRFNLKVEKCSPKGNSETLEYSCYTSEMLYKLKNIWNTKHPDIKISATNPRKIWEKLSELMKNTCNKESCWLKHKCLAEGMDKSIVNNVFAPQQPIEWKRKPTEWLSSIDILKVMKQYENAYKCFEFIGPTPIDFDEYEYENKCVWDELCKFDLLEEIRNNKSKIGIIFNLDTHDKGGSHWVSMFINIKKGEINFMDSYGDNPPGRITTLANRIIGQAKKIGRTFVSNTVEMRHQYSNSECGMYSLYFIIEQIKGRNWKYFNNIKIEDKKMKKLRKVYFNVNN